MSAFVGRAAELARISAAFARASAGDGQVVVIAGEPGVGKTTLAHRAVSALGARVVRGTCWEGAGAPPYWPWIEVFRACELTLDDALGPGASDADPDVAFRRLERAVHALRELARERPLVIVLDDLQWADAATLTLTKLLARSRHGARVLLIAAHRRSDARLRPEIGRLLDEIAREGEVIALENLDPAESAELVAALHGPSDQNARLYELSAGNPLYVQELVRARGAMPDGIRSLILGRLELLPERAFFECLALLAREERPSWIARALERDELACAEAARKGVDLGLLTEREGRVRFAHDIPREAVRANLSEEARARTHLWIADALSGSSMAETALHLLHARPLVSDARAIDACVAAAGEASRRFAHADAVDWLARGLELMSEEDPQRTSSLIAQARALTGAGQGARGREVARQAFERASHRGDRESAAWAALAHGGEVRYGLVDPEQVAIMESALAGLTEGSPPLRARLMARLAAARQPSAAPERELALAREAIALARTLDDGTLLAVLDLARPAFRAIDSLEERAAIEEELFALARACGDQELVLRTGYRLFNTRLEQYRFHELDELIALFPRAEAGVSRMHVLLCIATTKLLRGELDAISAVLDEADAAYRRLGDYGAFAMMNPVDLARCLLIIRRAPPDHREQIAKLGTLSDAVRNVAVDFAALRRGEKVVPSLAGLPPGLVPLAPEIIFRGGLADFVPMYRARLSCFAGRLVVFASLALVVGAAERNDALLDLAGGDYDRAIERFAVSLRKHAEHGIVSVAAEDRDMYARALLLRGREADRPRARELLEEALAAYQRMGIMGPADLARELLATLESSPRSVAAAPSLRLEGESWAVSFAEEGARLADSHGLRYLAHLVERPGVDVHVLDLAAVIPGRESVRGAAAQGALPAIDDAAKRAYRERLEDLREQQAEAARFGDSRRAERARAEIEALSEELASASGLLGRDVRRGATAEKARANVTQRIHGAIEKIERQAPRLAHHLWSCVRTGIYCRYEPPP